MTHDRLCGIMLCPENRARYIRMNPAAGRAGRSAACPRVRERGAGPDRQADGALRPHGLVRSHSGAARRLPCSRVPGRLVPLRLDPLSLAGRISPSLEQALIYCSLPGIVLASDDPADTGKLKMAGGHTGEMKESAQRAIADLNAKKVELGLGHDVDTSDFHVQVIDLIG